MIYPLNLALVYFLSCLLLLWSCDRRAKSPAHKEPETAIPLQPRQESNSADPIRSVDFANHTYPAYPAYVYEKGKGRKIKLSEGKHLYEIDKNGDRVGLAWVGYGDITKDGKEEAFVILSFGNQGTARLYSVYIYSMIDRKPSLLWSFETGDRIDDGLKSVYAEDGDLVVEQYIAEDNRGTCCPSYYQ